MSNRISAWTVDVLKELASLPRPIAMRCWQAIRGLQQNPFPRGVRSLAGVERGYRIRVGNYRIVYTVNQTEVAVLVIRVRHRKDAYRGL